MLSINKFIKGSIDLVTELIEFKINILENILSIEEVTQDSLEATKRIRDFNI